MYFKASALAAVALPALAVAGTIPAYDGMSIVYEETFTGDAGDPVNTDKWNIATCK